RAPARRRTDRRRAERRGRRPTRRRPSAILLAVARAAGQKAERRGRDRRARGERPDGRRIAPGPLGQRDRDQRQALLALARAGAEAGVALDLLDVAVAELDRVEDVLEGDVLAAAQDDLVLHAPASARRLRAALAAARPARWPAAAARAGSVAPHTSPAASTPGALVWPSASTSTAKPPAAGRSATRQPCWR